MPKIMPSFPPSLFSSPFFLLLCGIANICYTFAPATSKSPIQAVVDLSVSAVDGVENKQGNEAADAEMIDEFAIHKTAVKMADMLIAMQNDNEKIEQLANAQENMNADWNMKQEKHENTKAENQILKPTESLFSAGNHVDQNKEDSGNDITTIIGDYHLMLTILEEEEDVEEEKPLMAIINGTDGEHSGNVFIHHWHFSLLFLLLLIVFGFYIFIVPFVVRRHRRRCDRQHFHGLLANKFYNNGGNRGEERNGSNGQGREMRELKANVKYLKQVNLGTMQPIVMMTTMAAAVRDQSEEKREKEEMSVLIEKV